MCDERMYTSSSCVTVYYNIGISLNIGKQPQGHIAYEFDFSMGAQSHWAMAM